MNIHNILEDQVIIRVNNMYERIAEMEPSWFTCNCEQCRLDTTAYVLNKLPPRYIVSGRGLTHMLASVDTQMSVDMDSLIVEGMKKVAANARPFHAAETKDAAGKSEDPVFNFPLFVGTVYDGMSFDAIQSAQITLSQDGTPCTMLDHTWTNPMLLTSHTKGKYTFWVKPQKARVSGETKQFHFKLEIIADGFEKTTYVLDIPVTSSECTIKKPNTIDPLKIQDLYLFKTHSL